MKITKDKKATVVEISKKELQLYKVSFEDMHGNDIHTRAVIRDILSCALKEDMGAINEIILLPGAEDGCVLVCKEKIYSYTYSLIQ